MLADEGCWSHWAHNQDEELWMPLPRSLLSLVQNPSPAHTDDESSHLNQPNGKFSSQIDPEICFHGDSKFKLTIEINHSNLKTISSVIWSLFFSRTMQQATRHQRLPLSESLLHYTLIIYFVHCSTN